MKKASIETQHGTMIIELFDRDAPNTVANFEKLAGEGYYDNLTFHRVIDNFMIQGGCPHGTGTGGPGYKIDCEINPNKHERGTLSPAPTRAEASFSSVTLPNLIWMEFTPFLVKWSRVSTSSIRSEKATK